MYIRGPLYSHTLQTLEAVCQIMFLYGILDRKEIQRFIPWFGINDELTIVKNLLIPHAKKGLHSLEYFYIMFKQLTKTK